MGTRAYIRLLYRRTMHKKYRRYLVVRRMYGQRPTHRNQSRNRSNGAYRPRRATDGIRNPRRRRTMTREQLDRMRNAATSLTAIDPVWLRKALAEIDQLRSDLDGMCRLYEQAERLNRERGAELANMRAQARGSF